MTAKEAFQYVSSGGADDFERVITICEKTGPYCLVGGLAVNCYVEPVYTLDADLVVHVNYLAKVRDLLMEAGFSIEDHPYLINAQAPQSQLRIQFTKDPRYQSFVARAAVKEVLGQQVKVASLSDLVQGKIWAWADQKRRLSKRQKDQADLVRLAETYPEIQNVLPPEIQKLFRSTL